VHIRPNAAIFFNLPAATFGTVQPCNLGKWRCSHESAIDAPHERPQLNRLLHEFFDAHESVLSAARPHDSNDDHPWVRDFAVGQVVLTNEQQCESITGVLLKNEPPLRFRQTDF
jgi:hypothetical protein